MLQFNLQTLPKSAQAEGGELPILLEQVIFPGLTTLLSRDQSRTVIFPSITKNQKPSQSQLSHCFQPWCRPPRGVYGRDHGQETAYTGYER